MKTPRSGFTLVELLIVIAIIGILAGLVSSAVVLITRNASEKRIKNNAARLEAAIVEYWHDMGRWPIPDDAEPHLTKSGRKRKDIRSDSTSDSAFETTYTYALLYKGDGSKGDLGNNSVVVSRMLDALLPDKMTRKTFLDLHNFQVPAKDEDDDSGSASVSKWPVTATIDAWDAYSKGMTSPILVYFAKFVKCDHCNRYYFAGHRDCDYPRNLYPGADPECSFWKENGRTFRLPPAEQGFNGALPYVIEFDLANNVVKVTSDPNDFKFQE